MDQYSISWTVPPGGTMTVGWYDNSDKCIRFLLSAIRAAGGVVTAATIESQITTDLLIERESRPAHPPA